MTQEPVRPSCRRGTVVSASGGRCTVEFPKQRCSNCSGHCASSMFGPGAMRLTMRMRDVSASPAPGAQVWVAVPESAILRAAISAFGLPLLGLLAGSGAAAALGIGDSLGIWFTVSGFIVGTLAGALTARRQVPFEASLYDGSIERDVTLLNQAASTRSEPRSDLYNTGKTRIT